jgi:hypothetical protein
MQAGGTYGDIASQKIRHAYGRHERPPAVEDDEDWTAQERVACAQVLAVGFVGVFGMFAVIELADVGVVFVIYIFIASLGGGIQANDECLAWL